MLGATSLIFDAHMLAAAPPPHTHTLEPELAPMIPPLAPGALLPPQAWESAWFIRLLRCSPGWLLNVIADSLALLLFNPVMLW